MPELFIILVALGILTGIYVGLRLSLTYHIREGYLEVRLLGVRVRQLCLDDVRSISKYYEGRAENWSNTFRPRKRRLVLKRRRGWRRNFVITPEQRYVFKRKLEQARQRDFEVGEV